MNPETTEIALDGSVEKVDIGAALPVRERGYIGKVELLWPATPASVRSARIR